MTETLLQVKSAGKSFGSLEAVRSVTFEVARGEIVGLLGPNGAGKTTTMSMVCGTTRPSRGQILVDGVPLERAGRQTRAVMGVVPQEIALHLDLTARENLRFFGSLAGLRGRQLAARVDQCLTDVQLADRAGDRLSGFSGGMQRRINIAVGLLNEPRLLVLDEPTVGVDPQSRNSILTHIARLAESGTAVLLASHHLSELQHLCSRVLIMDHGELIAEGTPDGLIKQFAAEETLELLVASDPESLMESLKAQEFDKLTCRQDRVVIRGENLGTALPVVVARVHGEGFELEEVRLRSGDLETVFLNLTGRAVRDQ